MAFKDKNNRTIIFKISNKTRVELKFNLRELNLTLNSCYSPLLIQTPDESTVMRNFFSKWAKMRRGGKCTHFVLVKGGGSDQSVCSFLRMRHMHNICNSWGCVCLVYLFACLWLLMPVL